MKLRQKGKKERRHKRKKDKKAKGGEDNSGPVQISKYLKDRKKGKYSMISGKKIKMKVKKSKKDKQVLRSEKTPDAALSDEEMKVNRSNAEWSHTEREGGGGDSSSLVWCKVDVEQQSPEDQHLSHKCLIIIIITFKNAQYQMTLLLLAPLYLKSGMLHTLCDLSSLSIPFSTSSDTVLRSLSPAPSAAEVRPTVLPKGLILMRDLKLMRDMLMARLLFHWRASRCVSCSSFRWSRASRRTERNRPDTSCASGSLARMTSLNLCKRH
ncbi:hypothetical protein INR49_026327 [Caranx melampygus]|nr:hypothetical protein INR49_026327 [Caranx melampygus]